MTPAGILSAARRLMDTVEWDQGFYVETKDGSRHEMPQQFIVINGKAVPTQAAATKACAIGFVELALLTKDQIPPKVDELMDWKELNSVRPFLRDAIIQHEISLGENSSWWWSYEEFLNDRRYYGASTLEDPSFEEFVVDGGIFESVEDWNDQSSRTRDEVVAVFDRAIELAREAAGEPTVGPVTAALTA